MFFLDLSCQCPFLHCESQSTSASLGCPPIPAWCLDLLWEQLRLIWPYSCHVLACNVHSYQSWFVFFCDSSHCPFIYSIDTVFLIDHVDLICNLYSWWKGFWSSSLATLPLEFSCGFIPTSACGSSTGVCSWGCPGRLRCALVRTGCGGGSVAWITGTLVVPSVQRCWWPQVQELWHYYSLFLAPGSWHSKGISGWFYSVAWCSRHSKISTGWGPSLLLCASDTHRVTLSGVFLYWSVASTRGWGERSYKDGSSPCTWLSSTAWLQWLLNIAPKIFPTMTPPSCPAGLSPSSQQQPSPWDCSPVPMLQLPATVYFRRLGSLTRVHTAAARIVWFSLHSDSPRSAASPSNSFKYFPCVSNDCFNLGIWPLLQFP